MSEDTGCKHDTTYKMPDQSVVCVTCLRRERDEAVQLLRKMEHMPSGQCFFCARLLVATQDNVAHEHSSACPLGNFLAKRKEG